MIKTNSIVTLIDGRKGKVMGKLKSGEYVMINGKGGQVSYFKENMMKVVDKND